MATPDKLLEAFAVTSSRYWLGKLDFAGIARYYTSKAGGDIIDSDTSTGIVARDGLQSVPQIRNTLSFSLFRSSVNSVNIDLVRTDEVIEKFQTTNQKDISVTIWIYTPGILLEDFIDFPLYHGRCHLQGYDSGKCKLFIENNNILPRISIPTFSRNDHPVDQIEYILTTKCGLVAGDLDAETFAEVKALLPSWVFSTALNSETGSFDLLDRIYTQCKIFQFFKWNKIALAAYNTTLPVQVAIFSHSLIEPPTFKYTEHSTLCNKYEFKYYANPDWTSKFVNQGNNAACLASVGRYGETAIRTVSLADCSTNDTAQLVIDRYVPIQCNQHEIVKFRVPHQIGFDIHPGQPVTLHLPTQYGYTSDGIRHILIEKGIDTQIINMTWLRT